MVDHSFSSASENFIIPTTLILFNFLSQGCTNWDVYTLGYNKVICLLSTIPLAINDCNFLFDWGMLNHARSVFRET